MYYITVGKLKTRIKTFALKDAQRMSTTFRDRYGDDSVDGEPEFITSEFHRSNKEFKRALRLIHLLNDSYTES